MSSIVPTVDTRCSNFLEIASFLESEQVSDLCGVPDAQLRPFFWAIEGRFGVRHCFREETAIAYSAGQALSGKTVPVFMKNSGLNSSVDAIITTSQGLGCPLMLIVGLAGSGSDTREHHRLTAATTLPLLKSIGAHSVVINTHATGLASELRVRWETALRSRRPLAILVEPT